MKSPLNCFIWLLFSAGALFAVNVSKTPFELTLGPSLTNPLGYGDERLQFSWKLPQDMLRQTAYQIICSEGEPTAINSEPLWDSGWVETDQSTFVDYKGPEVTSRQKLYWKVRVKDENGAMSAWSASAELEMGLLEKSDWQASWIHLPQTHMDLPKRTEESKKYVSPPCPHFRKPFELQKQPVSARLYATAKGVFELHINGQRVGNDYLRPGWTNYRKRFIVSTYDVTKFLKDGDNCIGAILGEGWYAGRLGWPDNFQNYGKQLELLLQLEVTYADGTKKVIVTDDSWKATESGPIESSSFYDGEIYDANKELGNWTTSNFAEKGWASVEVKSIDPQIALSPQSHQPVVEIEQLLPVALSEPEPGRFVFDLGQNMVGVARIQLPMKTGQTVQLRFAEMLNEDGTMYTENYRSARSTDRYTAAGDGIITWQPTFSFHGFRYVEISGTSEGLKPNKDWVKGIVWHNEMPQTGYFKSSHTKLNQLQSNIQWGQKGNFLAVPTDCPQRDERLGWTGDAQVFAPTANFNFNTLAFFEKWCRDMRDEQSDSGAIPFVVPNVLGPEAASGWGDAAVVIPWEVYQSFGYRRILEDNYDMMKRWVAYYHKHDKTEGLIHNGFAFGDWLQPFADELKGDTSADLIGTAYFARSAELVAKTAAVLNLQEDEQTYRSLRDEIAKAFSERFFDEKGAFKDGKPTQTAYLLALGFDLLPESSRAYAVEKLVTLIRDDAGNNLRTGFLGTPLINWVLTRFGEVDLAYSVLFNDRYPGWFFSIDQGATTMWERWNSYTKKDGFGDVSMNSFNHYAYGAIGDWMYQELAGLQMLEPGYKHIKIAPRTSGPLDAVEGRLVTPYGTVASSWKRVDDSIEMKVTIPPNTRALIEFPDGAREPVSVGPGEYHYEL